MNFSWSQKSFFYLNRLHGRWPWFDRLMVYCAIYLIFFHLIGIAAFVFFVISESNIRVFQVLFQDAAFLVAVALVTSYTIGWIVPHRRPIVEFPQTDLLFHTMKTWKSFPSDHTIVVFSIWGMFTWFSFGGIDNHWPVGYSTFILISFFFLTAWLVAFSRIYCGVHYPRDILGGLLISGFYVWLFELSEFWWNVLYINGWFIVGGLAAILLFGYHRRFWLFLQNLLRKNKKKKENR